MWTQMKSQISADVVAHPGGAPLDAAYRVVLVAMVEMSVSGRKQRR
jgi:hypothetical protein